jgi:hypothetical protein
MAPTVINTLPFPSPRTDEQRQANFLASSRGIVGAVWDTRQTAWWIPKGLEWANDPKNPLPGYRSPFFGGTKLWENDDQGWVEVVSRRTLKRRARADRKRRGILPMREMPSETNSVVEE